MEMEPIAIQDGTTTPRQSVERRGVSIIAALLLMIGMFAVGAAAGSGGSLLLLAGGNGAGIFRQANSEPVDGVDLVLFWEVWNLVNEEFYYDLPSDQERVYGAIQGMLRVMGDPYTAFTDPDVTRILSEDSSGDFQGIGAYVEQGPEGGVLVTRVFEGGPAEQAGVLANDIIIAVDGVEIVDKVLDESLLLIRGEAGTEVILTVVRPGETQTLDIPVTRAKIEIPTVESELLEGNIGYIVLYEFNAQSSKRTSDAVKELIDSGAESIILDLRGNPGGYLDQAIAISDLFLDKGVVLIQRDVDGNVREYPSTNGDLAESVALVVLVDRFSASASEIVAGAVKDRGRGIIIGETTFGKGSIQSLHNLSDGSQLRITYANWYTPNDVSITEVGIEPDIVVEYSNEPTEEDSQLERAVEYLQTGQ